MAELKAADKSRKDHPLQKEKAGQAENRSTLNSMHKSIMMLQKAAGNRAVQGLIQAKLKIGKPNDIYEREADKMAERVLEDTQDQGMQDQSYLSADKPILRKITASSQNDISDAPESVNKALQSPGKSLDTSTRSFMESKFGYDFGSIRIHTDEAAAAASDELGANAFTYGKDIYFSEGKYNPDSEWGKTLLAHEITHTIQQGDHLRKKPVQGLEAETCNTGGNNDRDSEFNCYFFKLKDVYHNIYGKQMRALEALAETAGKDDPPPLWQDILITTAEICIVGAIGGVGARLAQRVLGKLGAKMVEIGVDDTRRERILEIVDEVVKDASKDAITRAKNSIFSNIEKQLSYFPDDVAKAWFKGQIETLDFVQLKSNFLFDNKYAALKNNGPDGIIALKTMVEEALDLYETAYDIQRSQAVQQWAVYQAQGLRGKAKDGENVVGTDMSLRRPGPFTADRGVLEIEGEIFDNKTVRLTSAEMNGMNKALRTEISKLTLGELKVPMKFKIKVGRELNWVEEVHNTQPSVEFTRNENGVFWLFLNGSIPLNWLFEYAYDFRVIKSTNSNEVIVSEGHLIGMRKLFDAMASLKPPLS